MGVNISFDVCMVPKAIPRHIARFDREALAKALVILPFQESGASLELLGPQNYKFVVKCFEVECGSIGSVVQVEHKIHRLKL